MNISKVNQMANMPGKMKIGMGLGLVGGILGIATSAIAWESTIDSMTAALVKGEKVQLSGFGTFEVKEREARIGRNPHTKESIEIPATKVPVFKASKALKDTVAK